ncbi:Sodium/hydrogen exchanger 3 [Tetrabaena socialis]|uniref:Sodium/hydrogen exchanger 3 n=1 Tax=Tetrabaena socialis TaxID=47790 RepID=A0A2J8ABM6_9CHLO|nr:Sodium/hydrogen exchanger 3 [Tetrabaena socialis]|eukprot:PNH09920.1 Sodium/hydrogen exchanger 3 [Tetrabaena socialis]
MSRGRLDAETWSGVGYLLPPVIFYAGLSVERRLFFSNLPSILSFGILGTLVSFVLISAALYSLAGTTLGIDAQDCLALGAVFAATDSVAVLGLLDARSSPHLFSLVFGEGIVNDATSVVLLGALARVAKTQEGSPGAWAPKPGVSSPGWGSAEPSSASDDNFLQLGWRLTANFA